MCDCDASYFSSRGNLRSTRGRGTPAKVVGAVVAACPSIHSRWKLLKITIWQMQEDLYRRRNIRVTFFMNDCPRHLLKN